VKEVNKLNSKGNILESEKIQLLEKYQEQGEEFKNVTFFHNFPLASQTDKQQSLS
jgi:hypothetical protein